MRHYYFIVTGYNVAEYIEQCLDSILGQDFPKDRYSIEIYFDGCTDGAYEKIHDKYINEPSVYWQWRGDNEGAAFARNAAINNIASWPNDLKADDVIITVDADDYLANSQVLNRLEEEYNKGADVTYGNLATINQPDYPLLRAGFNLEELTAKNFRTYAWKSSQLRTFKYKLYKNLHEDNFKDEAGEWLRNCTDLALMFPILEQADKPVFIPDILYIYRLNTGNNTLDRYGRVNKGKVNKYIRRMKTKYINESNG